MANLGSTFNSNDVPANEFESLPPGDYLTQIIESEVKPTKKKDGKQLILVFEVIAGSMERRRHWERLNIENPNPKAQTIAHQALAQLGNAVGVPIINDSEELHFKPVTIRLKVKKNDDSQYGDQVQISKYIAVNGGGLPAGKSQPSRSEPELSTARSTQNGGAPATERPWQRGA